MIIFAAVAVIFAVGYGVSEYWPDQNQDKQVHKPVRKVSYHITALGDSLTEGVGDQKNSGYAGLAVHALRNEKNVQKVTLANFGHKGDTSTDLLKVLKRPDVQMKIRQSNLIFMTIGGNDLVQVLKANFMDLKTSDFTVRQRIFSSHLNQIFTEIRRLNPSARIYYFGLYNPFEDYLGNANRDFVPILDHWNANNEKIAKRYNRVSFIPTADIFKGKGDSLLYEDHFHPNKKGYTLMAGRLLKLIKQDRPGQT
ncbi:GDSL family lipase [Sporolactobacillus sp. THM7-4]|nr:GDSL family lipase [Sporolactobacillus sp. THM7-4]